MNEEEEGFEEWDADFLDQLIQVEELALSSSSSSLPNPNPFLIPSQPTTTTAAAATTTFSYLTQPPQLPLPPQQRQQYQNNFISYSPPRELSQRPIDYNSNKNNITDAFDRFPHSAPSTSLLPEDNAKEQEIDRLKRELGRVSKQLTDLERECFELRKERNTEKEQIKSVYSETQEKHAGVHCLDNTKFGREYGVHTVDTCGISQHSKNAKALEDQIGYRIDGATSSSKAIGVQTDKDGDFMRLDSNNDLASCFDPSEKLLGIWGSTSDQKLGRNLMSKLFMACSADFCVLLGCMNMNMSSKITMGSLPSESSSHAAFQYHICETAKASHMYSVLTKISSGLLQLEALIGPLLDLCDVQNVAVRCSSLRILHVFLKQMLSLERKVQERDNVEVEGLCSGNNIEGRDLFSVSRDEASYAGYNSFGIRSSDPKILCNRGCWNVDIKLLFSSVNWVSLFELMHRIAVSYTEECVRFEAVSIMNVIVMRSNAYMEREKFGQTPIFESIAQLLKKEAGLRVQKEALGLLYLLLNCPKLLSIFCSGCKEGESDDAANDREDALMLKGFSGILEGLADSLFCSGNSIQDIELRKRAIVVLAFLASSGKSGFEIMVSPKLPGEANFLMLILQLLVSEMDIEVSISAEPAESVKARTLLIREALILLNRLASNPGYSATVLRVLTAGRDMASLTIDIASRLSRKSHRLMQSDGITRQMRESEIVDLAQVFKKRVFTYLGDKIS